MALQDLDWGNLIGQGLQAVTGYVNSQMQLKQAKKMAKAMQPRGGFPMMGYTGGLPAGIPGVPTGAQLGPSQTYDPFGISGTPLGAVAGAFGYGPDVAAGASSCPTLWRAGSQNVRVSPVSLVSEVNPATGKVNYWRHVGTPILFSGDVSHCKRVNKLLSRQSRRAGRRGPR